MKRTMSIFLVLMLLFALNGCSNNKCCESSDCCNKPKCSEKCDSVCSSHSVDETIESINK